jgi:hypothetical protein
MDGIEYQKVFDNSVGIETCLGIRKYVISVSIRKYVMKSINRKHVKKPLGAFRFDIRKYVISVSIRKYVMKSFNRKHAKKPLLRAFRLGTRTRNSFNC